MKDEQRIKEIEWRREDVLAEWLSPTPPGDEGQLIDNDIPWLIARVCELEAQAAKDAMRIRQLQAQVVKDAVVREAIKTALECLSYRERYWNAEVWDALDVAIVAAEEEAK